MISIHGIADWMNSFIYMFSFSFFGRRKILAEWMQKSLYTRNSPCKYSILTNFQHVHYFCLSRCPFIVDSTVLCLKTMAYFQCLATNIAILLYFIKCLIFHDLQVVAILARLHNHSYCLSHLSQLLYHICHMFLKHRALSSTLSCQMETKHKAI